jgi:hypothetical protein
MNSSIRNSRVAQVLLLLLVSLLVLELLSKGAVYYILDIKNGDYTDHYRNDHKLKTITWMEPYTPHPYFGYESPRTRASEKILSEVGDGDFVIGILGGSVAASFGDYAIDHPGHFESLREAIPAFGRKNLRIVTLADGGYKQPQQFFVVAYFIDKLDLVINIDGFNDALPFHLLPVYPLEFPRFPQFLGRTSQGGIKTSIGRAARWIYKYMTYAPTTNKLHGLSRSSLYFLCWYNLSDLLYRVVRASEALYYASEFEIHQSEDLRKASRIELIQKRIPIWKKYTILEDDFVRKLKGKPVFFFLQPNQYLKNSKPFSEQEKQKAFDPVWHESNQEMMVLLKAAAQDLRRSGVPVVDLTGIFSETKETVYQDDCCHVNDLGNEIMVDAIVSSIVLNHAGGAPKALRHE